ncbi:MAG: hypothetical protein MI974_15310 [Chitinophagales bacterium]|nr:hypothetical protein [Chitinophagales bacterium]
MHLRYLLVFSFLLIFLCNCKQTDPQVAAAKIASPGTAYDIRWLKPDHSVEDFASVIYKDSVFSISPFIISFRQMPLPETAHTQNIKDQLIKQYEAISIFSGQSISGNQIKCNLYPTIEAKGLALKNTQPVQIAPKKMEMYIVANDAFKDYYLGPQNVVILRALIGKPKYRALESGLSIYFNSHWQKKGFLYWASRLAQSNNLPTVHELFDEDLLKKESSLIMGTAAASFVHFLINEWGKETFIERYTEWTPSFQEIEELGNAWMSSLKKKQLSSPENHSLPYLKGFNFAHEGYAIYNGYGSKLSRQSLSEQASIGANTVALVPYSYMRDHQSPSFLPFMTRAGTETDESLLEDRYRCLQLGMYTVLKPQIWLGRNQWPGSVEMSSNNDWKAFFDYYYRWMRHYALLAEIHEMDMLCVGVEFAKASLQQPEEWRKLIRQLKGIYSGPLTYAANWGEEFEKCTFWGELDYIGLNCYYPLSKEEHPDKEELSTAFQKILAKAKKISQQYNRPLLFTEIGYTSTSTPWVQPHLDGTHQSYDGIAQKKCYEVVMENLPGQTEWCKGILWWKYPSYTNHGGEGHTGFTPNDKPTEAVLKDYFEALP